MTDTTPMMLTVSNGTALAGAKMALTVYSGLVPISP